MTDPTDDSRAHLGSGRGPVRLDIDIDIDVDRDTWVEGAGIEALITRAGAVVASGLSSGQVRDLAPGADRHPSSAIAYEAAVIVRDDADVRVLNRDFRGFDGPTNVLSFPVARLPTPQSVAIMLGDVVLARETIVAEASALGIRDAHHLQHLVIHGLLHLLGYDHETDADALCMETLETQLLAILGIADPYDLGDGPKAVGEPDAIEGGLTR